MNSRLQKLRQKLTSKKIDALLISSPSLIIYLTGYSGFSAYEREAYLLITQTGQYIITDGRYTEAVKEHIPHFTLLERTHSFTELLQQFFLTHSISSIGFEENNLTVAEYKMFSGFVKKMEPIHLDTVRIVKENEELSSIQHACSIGDNAFTHLLTYIKPGMTEQEIALELELYIRKQNGFLSFPPIVAFGKNSAVPHHHTSQDRLKKNDVILLDFGVLYDNYCSDMSRTIFIGEYTQEQKKVYITVLKAQQQATNFISDHLEKSKKISASLVDQQARDYITSQGYPPIPHALGHGIGVEVHEAPTLSVRSKQLLEEGMVFSIEPGIYLPGEYGVRIEDLFTIHNNKLLRLTHADTTIITL